MCTGTQSTLSVRKAGHQVARGHQGASTTAAALGSFSNLYITLSNNCHGGLIHDTSFSQLTVNASRCCAPEIRC